MAFARKRKLFGKTIGWNVFFSHPEAEAIAAGHATVAEYCSLAGVPPKVTAIIAAGGLTWHATCLLGGHDGVKAAVTLLPGPGVILLPR